MSENTSKGSPVKMALLLALHAVCGVIVFYLLLVSVPQYEKIFKDFGMKLPEMTVLVIKLSRLCAGYWYVLVPCIGAADVSNHARIESHTADRPADGLGTLGVAGSDVADGPNRGGGYAADERSGDPAVELAAAAGHILVT